MYARTTTIMADPARMDDGITDVRTNVMPAVGDMAGYTGLSMLCDRDSGRCIVTTGWESEEAMAASRDRVLAMRQHAAEQFGSRDPDVQEWEIAVVHRLHSASDDSCARVMWSRTEPAEVDDVLDAFRAGIIPRLDDLPGFCSLSLFIDRTSGYGSLTSVYTDRAAMDATLDTISGMRDEFTARFPVRVTDEGEFEVVVHSLRVPELV